MMKVQLIDYTGMHHPNPARWAACLLMYTKNTRLDQNPSNIQLVYDNLSDGEIAEELGYVANTVRSSWEFITYTFQFRNVTRAFTHQLVRTRTASFAQQSMRSVDMSGFEVKCPEQIAHNSNAFIEWEDAVKTADVCYQNMLELGIDQQDARGIIPTNVMTNIIMHVNLRTAADMIGKRKNLRAQGEYQSAALRMERAIIDVHPWADVFLNPERKQTPALDSIMSQLLGDQSPIKDERINSALKEIDTLKATWG